MKDFLLKLWKNEEGAETAEWILVVALIVAVAIIIYTGVLQTSLSTAVTNVGSTVTSATN